MHRNVISRYLSKSEVNIFDEIEREIEYEFNKPVSSIQDMKDRDNKKRKGDIWESFCKDWLMASGKYIHVWLLDEYNVDYPEAFMSRQDNGIDIIGQTNDGWHAIQCKYRKQTARKVSVDWKSLSTFLAMCERTRAHDKSMWQKYVVITNCPGVTRKLPRTSKDKSICRKSFQNTSRDHWLRMINKNTSNILNQPITSLNIIRNLPSQSNNIDELREKRLKYFGTTC
jgi:hypothetical protein